ncbi:MAG: EAL domain-containing protein [Gammaproteobacteria bacterium]
MAKEPHREDVRILFVEDNPLDVEIARLQLERDGLHFEWRVATSEVTLRAALREFEPDVVLCDYSMPGYSGHDAIQLIHRMDAKTPVLVLSGSITEDVAVRCLKSGAADCLAKHALARVAPAVRRALNEVIARKKYEARLQRMSNFDKLTGLPNAVQLSRRVELAIEQAHGLNRQLAVITLDIDDFGLLDSGFGRTASNAVLKAVGAKLRSIVSTKATVARIGSDEFAVLLPNVRNRNDVQATVRKLLDAISTPRLIEGQELRITASAGVASYPADAHTAAELITNATAALRISKKRSHDSFAQHSQDTARFAVARLQIEAGLHSALENGGLELYYQPQYDVRSRELYGVEALMRWTLPGGKSVSPAQFIPVAEETGLIVPLGEWALRQACATALEWRRAGGTPLTLGVNVSMVQLQGDFYTTVVKALDATGFPAGLLEFELTETTLVSDMDRARLVCSRLKELGCRVAIDDFGTGYSSLMYLSRLPVDRLKIDRSFVHGMSTDRHNSAIVSAVISLGHSLGMDVLAEGVETEAELAALSAMNCDQAQGFIFSRAVTAATIRATVKIAELRERSARVARLAEPLRPN